MDYFNSMLDTLKQLVGINSVQGEPAENAPFGVGPAQALDFILKLFEKEGFRTKNVDGYIGWAEIGEGELFGILAHLDTVPLGEGWTCPPLSCEIKGGEIYGRGVVDDKGPLVSSFYAVKSLLDSGKKPKCRIRFIFGCNEETDWKCINRYVLTEEIPALAISPDGDFPVINCEKGVGHYEMSFDCPSAIMDMSAGMRVNMVPDKAYVKLSCISDVAITYALHYGVTLRQDGDNWIATASGKCAHGSTPWLGDNALIKILNTVASLDEVLGAVARGLGAYDGSGCGLALQDDVSGKLSLTVGYGKLEGGKIKLGLDIRMPISVTNTEVNERLQKAFPFARFTIMQAHPPLYFAQDDPFVRTLMSAYIDVTGETDARPATIGGATYARALPKAVAFGPVFPYRENLCHHIDERVSVEDFKKTYEILRLALERLCF